MTSPTYPLIVEIYTKDYCPYCTKAKMLFNQLKINYTEIDMTLDPEAMATLQARRPGARTVPQIFIGNQPIGGCDDLYALHERGELLPLLAPTT